MWAYSFNFSAEGHRLSIKFRRIMNRLLTYANDMNRQIISMCIDLREEFKATREKNEIKIQQFGIKIEIQPSFDLEKSHEQMQQEWNLYDNKREQQIEKLTDEERVELDFLEQEIMDLQFELECTIQDYPQLLFQSLFIAVCTHFERYLIDLCNDVRESESLSLKPKDLHDSGIRRSQAYLKKVARLNFPDNTKEWQVIKLLSKIRNKLVHDPEHVFRQDEVDPKLLDYFWLHNSFWDDPSWDDFDVESNEIMFSLGSVQKFIGSAVRFSEHIDKAWEEHNNLRKKFQQGPKHKK